MELDDLLKHKPESANYDPDQYAKLEENGFSLIRVNRSSKRAFEKEWQQMCAKPRQIAASGFKAHENMGIAIGPASNVVCVDVDDPGKFVQWCRNNDINSLETDRVHKSPKGWHLFFKRWPELSDDTNRLKQEDIGCDIMCNRSYLVAPGSIVKKDGIEYGYMVFESGDIGEAPDWLRAFVVHSKFKKSNLSKLMNIPVVLEGKRNDTLYSRLCYIWNDPKITHDDIITYATEFSKKNGLPLNESIRTAKSAMTQQRNPEFATNFSNLPSEKDPMYPFFERGGNLWRIVSHGGRKTEKQMCVGIPKIVAKIQGNPIMYEVDVGCGKVISLEAARVFSSIIDSALINNGLVPQDQRAPFGNYFGKYADVHAKNIRQVHGISKLGWMSYSAATFCSGGLVFTSTGISESYFVVASDEIKAACHAAGDKQKWLKVFREAAKKPGVLAFFGAAVGSSLLVPLGEVHERFIVHIGYPREGGKTVLLKLTQSIWGKPSALVLAAKSTSKSLRKYAGEFGSIPMMVDEMTHITNIRQMIDDLTQASPRKALTKNREITSDQAATNMVFSAGEFPLSSFPEIAGGIGTRLFDMTDKSWEPFSDETGELISEIKNVIESSY